MQNTDEQRIRVGADRSARVGQLVLLAVLIGVAALWLLAVVAQGPGAATGAGSVPHVTVAPAPGAGTP